MKKFCLLVIAFLISCGSLAAFEKDFLAKTGVQGGLVVHLGCGKGHQTADLWTGNQFLVHGLDSDPRTVEKARQFIAEKGLYGKVSVNRLTGKNLPYADNIVNLLVVENDNGISREEMFRVLVPNGILYFKSGDNWKKSVKPWPKQRDEWTHFLHGPDGNPVAKDSLVGPPRYLQWNGSPKFSRGHEQQASFSSCVTSAGRIFYIADEAPAADIRIPSQWKLIARDAFNGIVLWKRDLGKWVSQFRRFRSGPVNLQFRVVAAEDRLFTTLDFQGPVSVLDAASGKTLRVIEGSEYTKQILHSGGNLDLLADEFVG